MLNYSWQLVARAGRWSPSVVIPSGGCCHPERQRGISCDVIVAAGGSPRLGTAERRALCAFRGA